MFRFFSKILPILIYPLGLACLLVFVALFVHRSWWQKGILILAFVYLFLGGNRWISVQLAKSLEWRYFPPQSPVKADVIIVLASGANKADFPRPIPEVGEVGDRLIYAAYLYQQGAASLILHCGGEEADYDVNGENIGGDIPLLLGIMNVPRDDVLLETESHNTYENAVACGKIMNEESFKEAILVTSAAHMPRAVGVFEHQGIHVLPAPTGFTATQENVKFSLPKNFSNLLFDILPNADNLKTTTRMLKEYLGIFTYRLRGWM